MRKVFRIISLCLAVVCILLCTFLLPQLGKTVDSTSPSEPTQLPTMHTTTPVTTPSTPVTIPYEEMPVTDTNTKSDIVHTLTFVGDCTLGTMPSCKSNEQCFPNVIGQNYQHPFAAVRQYFENDACTFINLEGVLANEGKAEDKRFTFIGPTDYVQILTSSSVEFANLSNNHTYDFGQAGYDSTVSVLENSGIRYVGRNSKTIFTTQSGLTIGVYGVYFDLDSKAMQQDVQALKDMGADIIVAACHWGIEREYYPNDTQKGAAYKLIDAGVNIVWGHHPHVLQPIEEYQSGIIYYSLGNFSFGGNHNPSDKDTAIIQQHIVEHADGSISIGKHTIIPCRLSSKSTYNDFQPTPYSKEDKGYERVLNKLTIKTPASSEKPSNNSGSSQSGSGSAGNTNTQTSKPATPTAPPTPELTVDDKVKNGTYMLPATYGFYRGTPNMETITKIVFTRDKPKQYDEKWYANLAKTSDIMGYRDGTTVYIVGEHIYANTYAGNMFARLNSSELPLWYNLQSVEGLELLNMSYCTQTVAMFNEQQWTEINGIANWDMSHVTDVTMMFANCVNLTTLDIGKWNVSKVKQFNGMFEGHSWASDMKFTYLPVENWDTSSARHMSHMFYGCAQLEYIPLENWDVSHVTQFSHTFADCNKLKNLDFSQWDTSSVVNFDAFLNDCHGLTTIDVSGLDTGSCKQCSQMFEACKNLERIIGIETWDVSSAGIYAFQQMFAGCRKLKELDLSTWNSTPDDTARMFAQCYALERVNLSGIDMSACTWVQEMFWDCTSLQEVVWKDIYDFLKIEGHDSMWTNSNPNATQTTPTAAAVGVVL